MLVREREITAGKNPTSNPQISSSHPAPPPNRVFLCLCLFVVPLTIVPRGELIGLQLSSILVIEYSIENVIDSSSNRIKHTVPSLQKFPIHED